MIGAISFEITSEYSVDIYLAGTYEQIDWQNPIQSKLANQSYYYELKSGGKGVPAIRIVETINGDTIARLNETRRYILKVNNRSSEREELPKFQNENNKFLKLDKDKDSIAFQFVNYLGKSKISCCVKGEIYNIVFEVAPEKISYEDDYVDLTESLAQICSELLIEYSGSTSNTFSQSDDESKSVLEQFIFLRQFCYSQNLLSVFELIKRNPDRLLNEEQDLKPIGAGRPSNKFYTNPFSYSRGWQRFQESNGGSYYLPQQVAIVQKQDTLDTHANRFIKYALNRFDDICVELIGILKEKETTRLVECYFEARSIHSMINEVLNDSFFDDISELEVMPQNNQVLQKREGYSQIFQAYSMIDFALQLNWKGKDEVYDGESKNVALLYEYWLFFELYKIVSSIEGCERINCSKDNFLVANDKGITISLEEGKLSIQSFIIERLGLKVNLYYNRTFSREDFKTTRYEGSYSRPFRPDYTLAIFPSYFGNSFDNGEREAIYDGSVSYIHFDAKYRVTDLSTLIGDTTASEIEEELNEEKVYEVINTYKRGDLLKMHTYNDAIRRTIGSYVLYPGNVDDKGTSFGLYDELLPGVGAFAIRPSIDAVGENELKNFITDLLESKSSINSRLNRMKHYMELVIKEPSINVKNVQTNNNGKDSECVVGYIRSGSDETYYEFLKSHCFLEEGKDFIFYFYAIKNGNVYSHHKNIFNAEYFCFYKNDIESTESYQIEPVFCNILSNELVSKDELVKRLNEMGFMTTVDNHTADYYYVLNVRVQERLREGKEIGAKELNALNGNDTFSPHSPKVVLWTNL